GEGSPVFGHRARGGCHSTGNRRDRCPGERPAMCTLPSATHFCETPPDLGFCLDFQVNRDGREGALVTALQEAGATARYPGHPGLGKSRAVPSAPERARSATGND